jgi:uroporphyrinogen-III synthase
VPPIGPLPPAWREAVTRDEPDGGPLTSALRRLGFIPVACPVLESAPPAHPAALVESARHLPDYAWLVCASARAVEALRAVHPGPLPGSLRTAAVGTATATALSESGAAAPPIVATVAGADAVWTTLAPLDTWPGRRVLVLTTEGGRQVLIDGLRQAGAIVDAIEAYRMVPRAVPDLRRDWRTGTPDAAVLASPRAVHILADAIGRDALTGLAAIVAIGETTGRALAERAIDCHVAAHASFDETAALLARVRAGVPASAAGERQP